MTSLGSISGAALDQYLVSARAAGLDISPALADAGLDEATARQPDSRVPGERFEILLERLIAISGDPLFGLHTSQFVQPGSYSVMGYIAMNATTLNEALSKVALYEKLVGDMGTTEVMPAGQLVEVRWCCRHTRQPVRRHLIENVFGSWVRYSRWLANNDALTPELVLFEHDVHDSSAVAAYEKVFGCEVRFNQPCSALRADPRVLDVRLRHPDPHLLSTLEAHAASKLQQLGIDTSLAHKVREQIRASLGERLPRKEQIACELGINMRTLHRRLREEGTTWQQVLDELRQQLALQYLRDSDLPQASIAERLGYSDIRSFQRSFKRHNGITPGDYRSREKP
ncbi:AraC family transcriptional regulator [Isoalcanivorax pacificus W11-5]|uniref:AraC family transcriptional regulator n=1 Tax=Isoalcanivorax pacificus W11-5 TaxID=391936 RepID=A0A0B4XQJ6_9GAMM|nr:AraC family transcriptional regulator [Isoalcanivorax pacificus]AJD48733.1 AraC family transcriptional regulator [Isoalcanivorax pacificus W11-5]